MHWLVLAYLDALLSTISMCVGWIETKIKLSLTLIYYNTRILNWIHVHLCYRSIVELSAGAGGIWWKLV